MSNHTNKEIFEEKNKKEIEWYPSSMSIFSFVSQRKNNQYVLAMALHACHPKKEGQKEVFLIN